MAAFTDLEDKTMAVQLDSLFISIKFDEWIKRHPNKYALALTKLREAKKSNITFKSIEHYI